MNHFRHIAIFAAAASMAGPALAQVAAPSPAPAAPVAPASPTAITDAEITSFAKAAIAADKVNKDAAIAPAEKPAKLAEVVTASGIDPNRFNEIAEATQADTALQAKVQAAIAAQQTAPAPVN